MKLVEIAGHSIDPGVVTYVGPIDLWLEDSKHRYFTLIVDGAMVDWTFDAEADAIAARQRLIAARELAQPDCCVCWPKHDPDDWGLSTDPLTGHTIPANRAAAMRYALGLERPKHDDGMQEHIREVAAMLDDGHGPKLGVFNYKRPSTPYPEPGPGESCVWTGQQWITMKPNPAWQVKHGDNGAMGASDALEAADILEGYNTGEFVIGTETPDTKLDITDDRNTLTLVECPATKLHIGDTDASDALVGVEA